MNRAQNSFLIAVVIAVIFCGCKSSSREKASKPPIQEPNIAQPVKQQLSKEAKSIISSRGLNSSSAYVLNPYTDKNIQSNNYETVVIPPSASMSDGFTTTIAIDHKNKLYWITRTGGFAGVCEKQGPFKLEKQEVKP